MGNLCRSFHLNGGDAHHSNLELACWVITKKQTMFGYKLHLLITVNGITLDFILAPAHQADVVVGEELLLNHRDRIVLGDKGYISAELASTVAATNNVALLTMPRQNQKRQLPPKLYVSSMRNGRSLKRSMGN